MNKKKICVGIIVVLIVFDVTCLAIVFSNKNKMKVSSNLESDIIESDISNIDLENIIENEGESNTNIETNEETENTEETVSEVTENKTESKIENNIAQSKVTSQDNSKTTNTNTQKTQTSTTQKQETTTQTSKTTKEESTATVQQDATIQNSSEVQKEETKTIDLSKYDHFENGYNGTYKGFIKDSNEISNLLVLIDECIKENGYTNVKIDKEADKSLINSGLRYFTANKVNVNMAISNCSGFTISYYAEKEYNISATGKETFFQTRSYIKVK